MDPNETMKDLLDCFFSGEREDAVQHAISLQCWIDQGGYVPAMDLDVQRDVVYALCSALTSPSEG